NQNDKIVDEKIEICNQHLDWLVNKSVQESAANIDFTQQGGALKVYTEKMNQAYAKFMSVKESSGIITEIKTANNSLKIAIENQMNVKAKVAELAEKVKGIEKELSTAKENWNNAVSNLTTVSNTYNQHVDTADRLFNELKISEKNKRIAQEKHDYASSIYLKSLGEVSDENYVSPQEKEVIIQFSLERAQVNVDVLNEIKTDNKTNYTPSQEYTDAMNEYKQVAEKHFKAVLLKTETDRGLKVQEDLVRKLDAELQTVYNNNIGPQEEKTVKEGSSTAKYVRATYNSSNNTYTFQLVKSGNANTLETLNQYFSLHDKDSYYRDVEEEIPGNSTRNITHAVNDSRKWLLDLYSRGDEIYIQDLMLAAIYLKYQNDKSEIDKYQFPVDNVPVECQGIMCNQLIDNYKVSVIEEAYKSVMSRTYGEQDLIKYLMFNYDSKDNDNGIITKFFSQEYAQDVMQARDYAKVKVDIDSRYEGLIVEAVAFGVIAATFGATAAFWGWPACLIPIAIAAGFTAAAVTAGVKASKLKNDVSNAFEVAYSCVLGNLNGFNSGKSDKINAIKKAQAELEAEWVNLKIMYNGTEDGSPAAISETTVRTAMKKRGSVLACNYDTMIDEIFTADVLTSSNAIASEDVSQAIIDVNSWFETEETRKETALNNVITKLKADQNEARAVYTASVEENAELTEAQKTKLHKLAVAASRDDITAEEKAKAKNEFNDYKDSLLKISVKNKNTKAYKNYKKDLKDLSIAAYGNNTWSSDVYLKDLYSLWHNIYPTTLDYSVSTENYTATALADFKQIVLTQFDYAEEVKLRMLKDQQDKERKQLATKRDAWEKQMAIIINIAEAEWDKAGESLVSGYNEWKTAFNKELEEKDTQWYENYTSFLQKKQDWIDKQYLYAVNVANSNVIARSGLDAESEIAQALADAEVAKLNYKPIDPEAYTDILIGESGLSKLMNSIESLQNRGKGAAVTRKHGYKINTSAIEAQHAAEEMMLQIENDMKNASAKLAAEQAERMVQDSIKASMERIDSENENMRTWEENMVRRSGYHVD
ncbi:MAG: hypothetical protein K6B41_01650, partial [Butyrivibrio sp.]|nr:hypothetical protein [Butyrivibrio sp.]